MPPALLLLFLLIKIKYIFYNVFCYILVFVGYAHVDGSAYRGKVSDFPLDMQLQVIA